jgi:uncharacterized membrane protein
MSSFFSSEVFDPIRDWVPNASEAHAVSVHFPVAMSAIGVLVVLIAALVPQDGPALRRFAAGYYFLLTLLAWLAVQTGERATSRLNGQMPVEIWEIVNQHENMAEKTAWFALATGAFLVFSFFGQRLFSRWMMGIAIASSIATAAWVGYVGHLGGTLVYTHGLGVESPADWKIPAGEDGIQAVPDIDPDTEGKDIIAISDFTQEEADAVSFVNDVYPIFEEACIECHRPGDLDSGLDMTTIAGLLEGGDKYGPAIVPGEPDKSTTVLYSRGLLQPRMPKDEWPLDEEQIHIIRMWIAAGANDDS